jgi:hypothetical protein
MRDFVSCSIAMHAYAACLTTNVLSTHSTTTLVTLRATHNKQKRRKKKENKVLQKFSPFPPLPPLLATPLCGPFSAHPKKGGPVHCFFWGGPVPAWIRTGLTHH